MANMQRQGTEGQQGWIWVIALLVALFVLAMLGLALKNSTEDDTIRWCNRNPIECEERWREIGY